MKHLKSHWGQERRGIHRLLGTYNGPQLERPIEQAWSMRLNGGYAQSTRLPQPASNPLAIYTKPFARNRDPAGMKMDD
jgi:hypothetical protein